MMMHPDVSLSLAYDRSRELVAEADRGRLLAGARRARGRRTAKAAGRGSGGKAAPVRGQPTGTVASCEPSAAVPAR